jgi:hypothetical protein
LDITNQELIDPDNWALCHRLAIITGREKLFLDSCDRLFERILTEAIEGGAAFDLIVKCFSMKFHSAIERRLSVALEQRMPSCGNEIGFLLAKTIDLTFRKLKFLVMESLLQGFVRIFRILPNKELFLSFHRRNLVARLLSGRKFCLLADLRLQTLARLPKVGSLLSDFRSSQSIVDAFESPSNVVRFTVIDSTLFQQTREIRPKFPAAIQDSIAAFEGFYTKKRAHVKIDWSIEFSTCKISYHLRHGKARSIKCPAIHGLFFLSLDKECNTVAALAEKIGVTVNQVEQVCRWLGKANIVDIDVGGVISVDLSKTGICLDLRMDVNVIESRRPNDGPVIDAQIVRHVKQHGTITIAALWEMMGEDEEVIRKRIDLLVKRRLLAEAGDGTISFCGD